LGLGFCGGFFLGQLAKMSANFFGGG